MTIKLALAAPAQLIPHSVITLQVERESGSPWSHLLKAVLSLTLNPLPGNLVHLLTRRSVEHCTPHADGAWLNELGWSQ